MVGLDHFGLDSFGGALPIRTIVRRGWEFELLSLRYYLERHCGKDRSTIWVKKNLACEVGCEAEIWESLAGDGSALPGGAEAERVEISEAPWHFAATLAVPASGLLRVKLERIDQSQIEVNLWLSAYDSVPRQLSELQADFEQRVHRLAVSRNTENELSCKGAL
jgi:hypothetical protein